jgi:stage II sporulation protein R
MKRKIFCTLFVIVFVFAVSVIAINTTTNDTTKTDYLRIHVRANSNSSEDQNIKYIVKDEVVSYITPYATECTTKEKAIEVISGILTDIEGVCDGVLRENGFTYTAKASIREEVFPTRSYGDLTLESGLYDALIIELGTGEGDNWWCVIYPPLCFTSATTNVTYKSAIVEIIKKWKG